VTYAWTAPSGSFTAPGSATTTFTSDVGGTFDLTVTVSDGKTPVAVSLPVSILGAMGGSGGGTGTSACFLSPPVEPLSGSGACSNCTTGNCSLGPSGTDGCCGLASASDIALCINVVSCFTNNAATCVDMGDGTNCFCGNSGGQCFMTAGAANGPCVSAVEAAAKTQSPPAIQGQFTSPGSPLGRGVNLIACRGSFCNVECGIP
jgi:hypothetical protein